MRRGKCWNIWWRPAGKRPVGGGHGRNENPSCDGSSGETPCNRLGWIRLQSLLATVVIAVFIITFVVQAFQIPSESMENTLLIGDYLLVDKFRYGGGGRFSGTMSCPTARCSGVTLLFSSIRWIPAQHFVKRVIGSPGDRVRLVNRQVYVNGSAAARALRAAYRADA